MSRVRSRARTVAGHGSSHRDDAATIEHVATAAIAAPVGVRQHALPIACAAVVVLHTFVVSVDNASPATYAMTSRVARSLDVATGVALMTAGAITAILRPLSSIAPVTASLGAVWLAPDWFGWVDGPSAARTLAMLLIPLAVPLLAHLVLAYPSGRIDGRAAMAFVDGDLRSGGRSGSLPRVVPRSIPRPAVPRQLCRQRLPRSIGS